MTNASIILSRNSPMFKEVKVKREKLRSSLCYFKCKFSITLFLLSPLCPISGNLKNNASVYLVLSRYWLFMAHFFSLRLFYSYYIKFFEKITPGFFVPGVVQ